MLPGYLHGLIMKNRSLENIMVRPVNRMLSSSSEFGGTNFPPESVTLSVQMHFSWGHPHSLWKVSGSSCGWSHTAVSAAVPVLFSNECIFYCLLSGSPCDGTTSQCYLLPALDTIFVWRKYRRGGLGMKVLHDCCQSSVAEDALGISCPISAAMYQGKSLDVEMLGKGYV